MPNDRVIINPNFKDNGEFHASLRARGPGAKDYPNTHTEVEYLSKGKFAASIGVGHRVFFDKADGNKPKKHKLTDERPAKDYVLIQSAKCCVEVYPYYSKYFDVQHEEVRLHEERWVVQRLFKAPDTWRDVDAYNPQIAVEEYSEPAGDVVKVTVTYDTDYGILTVEYFQRDGNNLKHNVTFKNTSGGAETFRVLQRWAGIVGAKCNGKDFPVDVDESFLTFRKADGKLAVAENLHSMVFNEDGSEKTAQCLKRPISIETHAEGMKADFIYGNWVLAQGESLEIDPATATLDDPTEDGFIRSTYTRDNTATYFMAGRSVTDVIYRSYVEWDVSGISGTITNTVFKYHGYVWAIDCHIHEMLGARPSTSGNQAVYDEIGEGAVYADPAGFPVEGTNQQVDLGASADSDLQSQLASGWFAIGVQSDNEALRAYSYIRSEENGTATPNPTLYVEYTVAPVAYEKTLTESLGLVDKVVKAPALIKTEPLGLLDTYSKTWAIYRSYSEILGLSDTIVTTRLLVKVLTELLGLSDTVRKDTSKILTENLGLLDVYDRTWSVYRTYAELLGLADSIKKDIVLHPLIEPLGLVDSIVKSSSITREELLGLKDAIIKDTSVTRTELLGLIDTITKGVALPLPEILGLLDTTTKSVTIIKIESLALKDSVSKGVSLHALTEVLGLLDSVSYSKNPTVLAKLIRKYLQLEDISGGEEE